VPGRACAVGAEQYLIGAVPEVVVTRHDQPAVGKHSQCSFGEEVVGALGVGEVGFLPLTPVRTQPVLESRPA
jgi:hypothetical protein